MINHPVLQQIASIIPLTEAHQQLIASKIKQRQLAPSEMLHRAGSICNFEGYIHKGMVRSYFNINGNDRIIEFAHERQWVCDFKSLLSQTVSNINIQAIEPTEVYLFAKYDLDILNIEIPNWDKLGKLFYEKLFVEKEKLIESLLVHTPEQRYLHLMDKQPQLIKRIPQYYLAQYVGVKPESLSRIRKRIAQRGTS